MLFKGFPEKCDALKKLRMGVMERVSSARWATEWEENAKPLISKASQLSLIWSFRLLSSKSSVTKFSSETYAGFEISLPLI